MSATTKIEWTAPIGTEVIVTLDNGREIRTKTRSGAAIVGGERVIWLEGISGCYLLSRVREYPR
ncbi:MAG: hypothetical protein KGI71_05560 [Patescibacteria group bacterium]|nr:hypothetical protein [Patescibacteria group bacterium]